MATEDVSEMEALRARVEALTAQVENLENEAQAERVRFLAVERGSSDADLAGKPENEIIAKLENDNKEMYHELQDIKAKRRELHLEVRALEKELESERANAAEAAKSHARALESATRSSDEPCAACASLEKTLGATRAELDRARADAASAERDRSEATARADAADRAPCPECQNRAAAPVTPRVTTSGRPTKQAFRDAVEVIDAHARGDAAAAVEATAEALASLRRDHFASAEVLLRRTLVKIRDDARDLIAGRKSTGSTGFGPTRELGDTMRSSRSTVGGGATARSRTRDDSARGTPATTPSTTRTPRRTPGPSRVTPRASAGGKRETKGADGGAGDGSEADGSEKGIFARGGDLGMPDEKMRKWIMEKQQKEAERAKMKRRVMQRDVKWMEDLKKRQADRNKAARKAEEAAEAERVRLKALEREANKPRPATAPKEEEEPEEEIPPAGAMPTVDSDAARLFD